MLICIKQIINNQTFWTAITAIFTALISFSIVIAIIQYNYSVWRKAQNIYTNKKFFIARKKILSYFDIPNNIPLEESELKKVMKEAILVCQRMDELAGLKQFYFKKKIIKYWGIQMGKSCLILENFINDERKHNKNKWDNFVDIAKKSIKKYNVTFSGKKLHIK